MRAPLLDAVLTERCYRASLLDAVLTERRCYWTMGSDAVFALPSTALVVKLFSSLKFK